MKEATDVWLPRFAKVLVVATFCLIFLGGMVTSMNAGLSVPDWPTSYGYNMFTFPIYRWVGGVFFEHTHRLLASGVGLMTTLLVAWIWRNRVAVPAALVVMLVATLGAVYVVKHIGALSGPEHSMTRELIIMHVNIWSFAAAFVVALLTTEKERWRHGPGWLRWLGFGAFLLVCIQGTLGGLRVTNQSIVLAMIHACTAQAFLCMTVLMAMVLSPRWSRDAEGAGGRSEAGPAEGGVQVMAWVLVGGIYCQLMIGAVMRHLHAGLSIPTFPLAFGQVIPPMLNERVAIHFAHRVGALVVTLLILSLAGVIFAKARQNAALVRPAWGLVGLLAIQIGLGASVIWTARDPIFTSLHVVNGAAVLATALMVAVRSGRLRTMARVNGRTMATGEWSGSEYQRAHA